MKFGAALEAYISDMRSQGRLTSQSSERHYRDALVLHAEDSMWRDPRMTTRDDVKRTLQRWKDPNTSRNRLSILTSFYDWLTEEGLRKDNPARQVRRPRKRQPRIRRLTHDETLSLLEGAETRREKRAVFLGVCAGLRSAELRGLQGRHFKRSGFVHVPQEIAKGSRERWVPILPDLEPVVAEIQETCEADDFVLPAQRKLVPGEKQGRMRDYPKRPCSAQSLWRLVSRVAERVGIEANPHAMRHAYADFMTRHAGVHMTQALLGHASIDTTQGYLSVPTLDELAAAVQGFSFGGPGGLAPGEPEKPVVARRGFEPLLEAVSDGEPTSPLAESIQELLAEKVPIYVNHLGELERA